MRQPTGFSLRRGIPPPLFKFGTLLSRELPTGNILLEVLDGRFQVVPYFVHTGYYSRGRGCRPAAEDGGSG